MKKNYQSDVLGVIHQSMRDLHEIGAISDSVMREFDEDCLAPERTMKTAYIKNPAAAVYAAKLAV
jgi:DNA-binding transcriptional regulator YiaG